LNTLRKLLYSYPVVFTGLTLLKKEIRFLPYEFRHRNTAVPTLLWLILLALYVKRQGVSSKKLTGWGVGGRVCGLVKAPFSHMPWTTEDHT